MNVRFEDETGREWAIDRTGRVGPPVVTLCGSMRFWPLMVQVAAAETRAGRIVLAPFVIVAPAEQDDAVGRLVKAQLDELHRAKIAMSGRVLVVTDPTGYWGESTRNEIRYALSRGLPVHISTVDRVTGTITESDPVVSAWLPREVGS